MYHLLGHNRNFVSVKVISAAENASASFDNGLGNNVVENPLVDAANTHDAHADKDHISVRVLKNKGIPSAGSNASQYPEDLDIGVTAQHQKYPSRYSPSAVISRLDFRRPHFQSRDSYWAPSYVGVLM